MSTESILGSTGTILGSITLGSITLGSMVVILGSTGGKVGPGSGLPTAAEEETAEDAAGPRGVEEELHQVSEPTPDTPTVAQDEDQKEYAGGDTDQGDPVLLTPCTPTDGSGWVGHGAGVDI